MWHIRPYTVDLEGHGMIYKYTSKQNNDKQMKQLLRNSFLCFHSNQKNLSGSCIKLRFPTNSNILRKLFEFWHHLLCCNLAAVILERLHKFRLSFSSPLLYFLHFACISKQCFIMENIESSWNILMVINFKIIHLHFLLLYYFIT